MTWLMESTVAATNQGSPKMEQTTMRTVTMRRSRWYPPPFFSLCSFRLTITAVICWSMKMRMEASSAGTTAAIEVHHGFGSSSWIVSYSVMMT